MTTRAIPFQAVRDALWLAVVRRKSPCSNVARFAAYTRYPNPFAPCCADPRRLRGVDTLRRQHMGPLQRGDMERLLRRHRAEAGLAGVRKTWGAGMRELQAEFETAVIR